MAADGKSKGARSFSSGENQAQQFMLANLCATGAKQQNEK
jgi:hypothetical protein